MAVLFADVRGQPASAAGPGPTRTCSTASTSATSVLLERDALIDKLISDEVMALFMRGFAGGAIAVAPSERARRY
jgi:adenylate cyclase